MAMNLCDARFFLVAAAVSFILLQVHLFSTQTQYAERLEAAIEAENQCASHSRLLIDQISNQQEKIVHLEDMNRRYEEQSDQLRVLVRDLEKKSLQGKSIHAETSVAAVVIMACNRPDYLARTILSVMKYHSVVSSKFPLFVSQDGTNPYVKKTALSYGQITYLQHIDLEPVHTERPGELIAYYKIARHYKWALDELFLKHNFERVIILEDDMEIAPDFFDYFEATAKLLNKDKLKDVRKDRQFIRPEICRTYNFGEHGSSMGQFFKQYLESIKLNDIHVDWKSMDLNYLMEGKFSRHFAKAVMSATEINEPDVVSKAKNAEGDVQIQYRDQSEFERIAGQFGIFQEWKDGIPRTAYKGVVVFRHQSLKRIFFVGPDSFRLLGISQA
ncbi:hypothetical protein HPP92_004948 [Vanilla planifolia]|uniref:Alpha-1,3-mannosyl-glycoprotein 2-beta-N-acetylglucosaminyltransferase n=2 Tax=Vanilla planifolia TaxID=51239 RepID=A0A835RNQ0_VANPL|nr:hypothetical protein HPP92_004948 [Vanilla planifolia]